MPGTAAKKYEEGIFMKKIVKGILLLAAAAAVVTGSSRKGRGGAEAPTENSVYVAGDGSVRWASVETYQQGSYTEDELKNSAGQKIIDFNSGLGKAASYENAEGSEKLPVAIVSASMGNGTATLVTEYDAPGRLIEFAQEIGDYNVPFTQLDTGRGAGRDTGGGAAMSGELAEVSFQDEKGKAVDQETALKDGQSMVVKAAGQGVIVTEKKIQFVSEGCVLKDSNRVQTSGEGTSYIILK